MTMIRGFVVTLFALTLYAGSPYTLSTDGLTVYDSVNGITWLANANLPASNRFGIPACTGSNVGVQTCINPTGSMNYNAAAAWVAAMNAANYLGHNNWQLPTTPPLDGNCGKTGPNGQNFGYGCTAGALDTIYNNVGLKSPNTAVPIPANTPVRSATCNPIFIGRNRCRLREPAPATRRSPSPRDGRARTRCQIICICGR